jgi:hypothetical protein
MEMGPRSRRAAALLAAAAFTAGCMSGRGGEAPRAAPAKAPSAAGPRTVAQVVAAKGPAVEERLAPLFRRARLRYPPRRISLLAFKREQKLEVWAANGGSPAFIRSYRILGASGHSGPKLKQWDLQVPEGIYRVTWLHPNSSYHLSMKLDYPNAFDRRKAREDARTDLGGDIFIHGDDVSIGCIAIGDAAIEDLFVLAARVGISNVEVVIAPSDLRRGAPPTLPASAPAWTDLLYARIDSALERFRIR